MSSREGSGTGSHTAAGDKIRQASTGRTSKEALGGGQKSRQMHDGRGSRWSEVSERRHFQPRSSRSITRSVREYAGGIVHVGTKFPLPWACTTVYFDRFLGHMAAFVSQPPLCESCQIKYGSLENLAGPLPCL